MFVKTARDIGLVIRERRRALGLDQRMLAERVGVSRQWVVAVEKGKPRAEVGLILRTLRALDLHILVEGEDSQSSNEASELFRDVPDIDIDAVIDRAKGSTR